ncbi:MAG TPA: TolC family protein [Steroidobacteraceae bacterium]|nr:TolC family protein [Steroidobacteraceae bacterium]
MKRAAIAALLVGAQAAMAAAYPDVLPPEEATRAAIATSPRVEAAREQVAIALARKRQLEVGQYEWGLAVTGQHRTDAIGATYSEQSYELSRGMRLFGKAGADRALGAQVASVGEFAFADAWHEAGRTLLADWFDWLRAKRQAQLLGEQITLLAEQVERTRARVRAGDAPRLEVLLAQTELDRAASARMAAEQRAQELVLQLKQHFPDFEPGNPQAPGAPELPAGTDDEWVQRILADNHEIALAEGELAQAKLAAERAGLERMPDPTIGFRYSNNFDGNDRVLGVNVTVPIGGAQRRAQYSIARSQANVAAQHAREVRLKVEADARKAALAVRSTYSQWTHLRDVSASSETNATAVARGYSLGEFTITELIAARRQSLEAAQAAARAQLDAMEAACRLELEMHEIWSLEPPHG